MTTYLFLILIFIFLEIFESTWQKAPTLYGVIYNNYSMYKKNIFYYFLLNPTFIYSIFLAFYLNLFNFWISSIVVIKFIDISFRLHLINKLSQGNDITHMLPNDLKMNLTFRYLNVLIYPMSFIFGLNII